MHSLPRILLREGALSSGLLSPHCAIPSRSSAHLRGPLRLGAGSQLRVFDGASPEFVARISLDNCSRATLLSELRPLPPPQRTQTVLLAPPLDRARHAFLVEKATELGADAIVHVHYDRAERLTRADRGPGADDDDFELSPDANERAFISAASAFCAPARQHQLRMRASTVRAWARDATQQSERLRAPLLGLAPVLPLSDALRLFTEAKPPLLVPGPRLVLFCDERLAATRSQDIGGAVSAWRRDFVGEEGGAIALIIGPEGGLTDKERAIASSSTLTRCVRLTSSVLRAETAAIAALAQLLSHL